MVSTKKASKEPVITSGSRLLSYIVGEQGTNATGKKIGCQRGMVSKWARGMTVPDATWRIAIKATLGIPFEAWETVEEKPAKVRKKKAA